MLVSRLLDDLWNIPNVSLYYYNAYLHRDWRRGNLYIINRDRDTFYYFMYADRHHPNFERKFLIKGEDLDYVAVLCHSHQTQLVADILDGCWVTTYDWVCRCARQSGVSNLTGKPCKYISSRLQHRQS